jgi:spore coat polysaccharide biosynthesis predicted glycosyltransferase SpsG
LTRIDEILSKNWNKTIGFYVPLRAIPYLSTLKINRDFRFFDDSDFFRNKYLDGFEDIIIEGFEELKKNPVDIVIIMTHAYGTAIDKRIRADNIETKIVLLQDLFDLKG